MSAEIQDELVTGTLEGEEQNPQQTASAETANLLDFGDGSEEPTSTTDINGGIQEIPNSLEDNVKEESLVHNAQEDHFPKEEEAVAADDDLNTMREEEVENLSTVNTIDAGIGLKSPLGRFLVEQKVSPTVINVIYWKNVYKSAGIFGGAMFLLLSMYCYSLISVITNFGMAVLAVAFLYRIGMTIVNAVQKTSAEHPFKNLLEEKIEVSEEIVNKIAQFVRSEVNCTVKSLQKLFLVQDVFQSLKFGMILWLVSYIGSWMSPLTVVVFALVVLFSVPKLYEEKQNEIEQIATSVSVKVKESIAKVEAKLPEKVMAFIKKEKKD